MVKTYNEHTAATDAFMAQQWALGYSATEIGKLMGGWTKNAVIGRVHRLKLPSRPNPIRGHVASQRGLRAVQRANGAAPTAVVSFVQRPPAMANLAGHERPGCQFPLWGRERPGKNPLFCKAQAAPGGPWCPEHRRLCYQQNARDMWDAA